MKNILDNLNIPKSGKTKQRIALKDIAEQLNPSTKEKRILSSEIDSIYLVGVLDLDTIRIQPYIDEDYRYESIYVIRVMLKSNTHFATLNERLHMAFPNPVLIVYQLNESLIFSTALKRINKNVKEKSVIESIYTTNLFAMDESHKRFLEGFNLQTIQGFNLKHFYESLVDYVFSERVIALTGTYLKQLSINSSSKRCILIVEYEKSEVDKLYEKYKQASMMSEKMDIHMRIKEKELKILNIVSELKLK
ncbi:MAG: DUF4391 domain-containing protein [Acholeplasmataceae bacterium]|nr:DUF4391 domain-containing protein [Acholeplasmataceae bacterium]